jgi:hypothetical protein
MPRVAQRTYLLTERVHLLLQSAPLAVLIPECISLHRTRATCRDKIAPNDRQDQFPLQIPHYQVHQNWQWLQSC